MKKIELSGITWITTYNCNISCDHCFFFTQGNKRYMDPELVNIALKDFKYGNKMFWQHFSGGEIFLNTDKLIKIIQNLRKYFDKDIGLVTNGFWAKSIEESSLMIDKLKGIGVTSLSVSSDYFHQTLLDKENPRNLISALATEKMNSFILSGVLGKDISGSKNLKLENDKLFNDLPMSKIPSIAEVEIRSIGKGSKLNIPKKKFIPQGKCTELSTCLGENESFNPKMIWIDPYGNVMICYGITIGNLYKNTLNEIIESYDPKNNILLSILSEKGPKGLYEYAISKGIDLPDEYYDECDLCYQVRSKLRMIHSEVLSPMECYPV